SYRHTIGSNVTIDGCLNGQNGVTYDQTVVPGAKNALLIVDTADNIIIRCLNFQSTGAPNSEVTKPTTVAAEENFIWLAGGSVANGGTISNVLIDRCTFYQATNKAIDITNGDVFTSTTTNVTVQRSLFHDNALTSHVKYADGITTIR